jgi:hypothetical protein
MRTLFQVLSALNLSGTSPNFLIASASCNNQHQRSSPALVRMRRTTDISAPLQVAGSVQVAVPPDIPLPRTGHDLRAFECK